MCSECDPVHHAFPTQMNKQMKNHTHQILNSGHPNFDYWMTKWLNVYLGLANPALAYIQLRQRTNVQTLHKASHSCKQMQNYTLSILQFLSCKHVCIYTFMTPFNPYVRTPVQLKRDWKSAIFVSAAGARLTLDEYTYTLKWTKATRPLLLAALRVCSTPN